MKTTHRIILIFTIAFVLNALWEFWHAQFYEHYQGGAITAFVLLRAAMIDAVIITTTIFVAIVAQSRLFISASEERNGKFQLYISSERRRNTGSTSIFSYSRELAHEQLWYQYSARALWFAVPLWLIVAVFLEKWALSTDRWAYNDMMPIIPFVQTGLTPTIQLALLGTASWYIAHSFMLHKHKKTR